MQWALPGTGQLLEIERAQDARLLKLSAAGRLYYEVVGDERRFDSDFVRMRERIVAQGIERDVYSPAGDWTERYLLDRAGLLTHVDGADVERDERQRIVRCGDYSYGYAGDALAVVDGPHGLRRIARTSDGKPVRVNGRDIDYRSGARDDISPLPARYHRDEYGRLWTICAPDGRVLTTYLWDGFACLGRIDGPLGMPLSAAYSLDPSRTPVRVIERKHARRVARDAFGEVLLGEPGVPGLHGGIVHDGYVHYRSRVLDPRLGSYDRPDPYHGGADDPRRLDGYLGQLPIERARSGPYAACQYDPVSYLDPTGENTGMTVLLLLSDLTWSLQHNLAGWFGMDFTLNFWIDLFSIVLFPQFFEFEGFHSERTGRFGTRRGGVFSGARVFTYQHQLFGNAAAFDNLRQAQLFDPKARFEPELYGTLLLGQPDSAGAFVLQGDLDAQTFTPFNWSRAGGSAEAIAPGLPAAYFPSGGLHFDNVFRALLGPRNCTMTELRPAARAPVAATIAQTSAIVDFPTAVSGLSADVLVLLTDATTGVDIESVISVTPQGTGSRVRLHDNVSSVSGASIRLRGLGAPEPAETLNIIGPASRFDLAGSARNYAVNDALRLTQSGSVVGAAIVRSLEAQLQLDGALPAAPPGAFPLEVRSAAEGFGGNATLANNTLTQSGASPLPNVGDPIVLRGAGQARGAIVIPNADPNLRELDRSAAELAPLGAAVTWAPLSSPTPVGQASSVDAAATLTYAPSAVRTAPSAGPVLIAGTGYRAVRVVTGLTYDALVIGSAAPPGTPASPYQVERLVPQAPDLSNGTLGTQTGLTLPPNVTLQGSALRLQPLNAPALSAVGAGTAATLSADLATLTGAGAPPATPNPSDLVVLRDAPGATTLELAVVRAIEVSITLDRSLTLPGPDLRLVQLAASGFAYDTTRVSDTELTVLPAIGGANVQLPRFRAGEIVQVGGNTLFRVQRVDGSTLRLEDGLAVLPATPGTVQRMVPTPPTTVSGTPWVGISGTGSGTNYTFRMWAPNAASRLQSAITPVAIASRDASDATRNLTRPAFIASSNTVALRFTTAPTVVAGNITVHTPNQTGTPFYAPGFTQTGSDILAPVMLPGTLPGGNNLLVTTTYEPTSVTAAGEITAGNVLCPNDPENWEFNRRQSLAEHELTHTCQSATWGPLYMGYLPLFALELASELFTDVELPEFSASVNGEIVEISGRTVLRIPDFASIDVSEGARVQVSSTRFTPRTVSLGAALAAPNQNAFPFTTDISLSAGAVSVRKQVGSNLWTGLRDVVYNALHILTLGGVMNLVAGGVWGGLIFGIGKLWYFMSRRWFGGGQEYPATVAADRRAVTLSNAADSTHFAGFNEVIVRASSGSAVRGVSELSGATMRLSQDSEATGDVRLVPYKSNDISDWHDYYDATVPDAARPASIRIAARSGGTLTLHPFDRVTIAQGVTSFRTNVTAVNGDTVELEQAPAGTPLRISKVDENDPIGSADSRHLSEMGVGWLRWFFDPYAQLQLRLHPERNGFPDILARIARYGFSSHSWSAAIPGSLFFNNLFSQPNSGHRTPFEQDASSESGNVYSPLSRLRGSFNQADSPFATYTGVVGDIGRFWHVPLHDFNDNAGQRVPVVTVLTNLRDTPGTHLQPWTRVQPLPSAAPSGTLATNDNNEPNTGVTPNTPDPGRFVPDALTDKYNLTGAAIPDGTTQTGPVSFAPNDLAFIPTSAALNQTVGCYAAFTRSGTHRLTVQDGLLTNWQGRDAQQVGVQTLWFDVNVADVTVTAAGQPLATQDPPATVSMVLLQRLTVAVAENIGRSYALTVTRPGAVVETEGLELRAGTAAGSETAELSRFYAFTGGAFSDAVLSQHGMHLPGDLHVPVRMFTVSVGSSLPVRDAAEPTANTITTSTPGAETFLLVPVAASAPPVISAVSYPGGATPGIVDPAFSSTSPQPSAAARSFLGAAGVIFRMSFTDPPEETADLTLSVGVQADSQFAQLSSSLQLVPHFRMVHGAGTYMVAPGAAIELNCVNGVTPSDVQCSGAGVAAITVTGSTIRIEFAAGAAAGPRTVTASDAADTSHRARRTIRVA